MLLRDTSAQIARLPVQQEPVSRFNPVTSGSTSSAAGPEITISPNEPALPDASGVGGRFAWSGSIYSNPVWGKIYKVRSIKMKKHVLLTGVYVLLWSVTAFGQDNNISLGNSWNPAFLKEENIV